MGKKLLFILVSFLFVMAKSEALLDFFDVYSKRNREIDKAFVEALSNEDRKWKQEGLPLQEDCLRSFVFIPEEKLAPSKTEAMEYAEWDLKKSKNKELRNLQSIYIISYAHPSNLPRDGVAKILYESENEIRFETIAKEKHLVGKIEKVGDDRYTSYTFTVRGRNLSPEEKVYWFELFDYLKTDYK